MTEDSTTQAAGQGVRHSFTVRLLGQPFPLVFALSGHSIYDLPGIDGRPYSPVTVRAAESDTLAEVLDRAAIRSGLSELNGNLVSDSLVWIRFRESEDDRFAYNRLLWAQQLTIVDGDGKVRLARKLSQVLVRDLLRTAEADLIDGDPLQPYLIATIPQGGLEPWGLDWSDLIGGLTLFWAVLGAMDTLDGAASLVTRLRGRLRRAPTVLAEKQLRSGGTPELLSDVLHHRPILPAQAAEWLDCTVEDVEALLLALGLDDRGDGLWAPETSDEARLMSEVVLELRDARTRYESRDQLPDRLQHLIETGERLPVTDPWEWKRQFETVDEDDDEDFAEDADDEGPSDVVSRHDLPLDRLRLQCSCDDPACEATAKITYAGDDRLRFDVDPPGHFEAPSGFLERLLIEQEERAA